MFEYDIKRFTRRCAETDVELRPGDVYYSVLLEDGDDYVRKDISSPAWQGPPEGAIGWWRCQVAPAQTNRAYWAPPTVLLDYFSRLMESADKREQCFLMALAMIRRRLMQIVEYRQSESGKTEMVVHWTRTKQEMVVPVCEPAAERIPQLQAELCEHLFTDRPLDSADADVEVVSGTEMG